MSSTRPTEIDRFPHHTTRYKFSELFLSKDITTKPWRHIARLTNRRLKITADFSHWMVCCERILDISDEDRALLDEVIPRVSEKKENPCMFKPLKTT
jgi:hypothetical protein